MIELINFLVVCALLAPSQNTEEFNDSRFHLSPFEVESGQRGGVLPPRPIIPRIVPPPTTVKMTPFNPAQHGFRFANTFKNSVFGPPITHYTNGLCGGMSYAALDYFLAGKPIPVQTYRPSHNTLLQTYFYRRQETSLFSNLDKWAEYDFNPGGARTLEMFNWGLRERLTELRSFIDRGVPVPLGLKGTSGGYGGDHQVLAIGYDMARYKGDVGNFKEDLRIFLCEPNFPDVVVTMMADPSKNEFYYKDYPWKRWRSYFVDGKYAKFPPPTVPNPFDITSTSDGLLHALLFRFETGNDELQGGASWLNLTIVMHNGTRQFYPNISQSGRWLPQYEETVEVRTQPIKLQDIRFLELNTNNTRGPAGDIWDMKSASVEAKCGGFSSKPFRDATAVKFMGLPMHIVKK